MKKRILSLILFLVFLTTSCSICPPPEPPPPPPPPTIDVDVCKESELLPNEWCPEIITKTFIQGEEPTEVCKIHQPPPPPPPPPPPKITKIVSSGCYDLMTADGNLMEWLETIADIGANGFRFFAIQYFGQKNRLEPFQPYPVVGIWIHPTINKKFPLFRLRDENNEKPVWNEDWWDKYKDALKKAKQEVLTAHIVADTHTDLKKGKEDKYNHPWYCSVEALGPDTPGGVWGEAMKKYHADLYERLIKEALNIGVDFTFEITNEYDAKDWDDEFMIAWHKWATDEARKIYPGIKLVASPSRCGKEIYKQVDIYSFHGIVRPEKIDFVKETWGDKKNILISGDGGFDGDGPADKKGRKGSSPEQMEGIAEKIYEYGYPGHEYFDRGLYKKNNDRANLDDFHPEPLKALVEKCGELENNMP